MSPPRATRLKRGRRIMRARTMREPLARKARRMLCWNLQGVNDIAPPVGTRSDFHGAFLAMLYIWYVIHIKINDTEIKIKSKKKQRKTRKNS